MYRITVIIQTRRVGVYTVDNYSKNKNKKGRSIYSIHRSGGEVTLQGKKKGGGGTAVGRSLRSLAFRFAQYIILLGSKQWQI